MSNPKRLRLESSPPPSPTPLLKPILPDELTRSIPLVSVYVATIKNPRTTSKIVVKLNTVLPIQELIHLKRVRGRQILLFPANQCSRGTIRTVLLQKGFDADLIEDGVEVKRVARFPPKVRKQYDAVHPLWPCNFHQNPYLEKLSTNTLFGTADLDWHAKFMAIAIEVCKLAGAKDSTVVVDPKDNSVVAFGFDQRLEYPTKHSVMVAVDNVAKTQKGGQWENHRLDAHIEETIKKKYGVKFGYCASLEGPYLCTGYSVYCVDEPCITCAMALIHSRAKRVFFSLRSQKGALESLCKIHCVEGLNHHYEVFAGLLEDRSKSL